MNKKYDLVIVGCSAQKKKGIHPAEELYTSSLFQKSAEYAKRAGVNWMILSAKYGVVEPWRQCQDYDRVLSKQNVAYRQEWRDRVIRRLVALGYSGKRICILAGRDYEFVNLDHFPLKNVETPLSGKGIGKRLKWLNEQNWILAEAEVRSRPVGRPALPEQEKRIRLAGGPTVAPDTHKIILNLSISNKKSIGEILDALVAVTNNLEIK